MNADLIDMLVPGRLMLVIRPPDPHELAVLVTGPEDRTLSVLFLRPSLKLIPPATPFQICPLEHIHAIGPFIYDFMDESIKSQYIFNEWWSFYGQSFILANPPK